MFETEEQPMSLRLKIKLVVAFLAIINFVVCVTLYFLRTGWYDVLSYMCMGSGLALICAAVIPTDRK